MRQLTVHVPREFAERIARLGRDHDAFSPVITDARTNGGDDDDGDEWAFVTLNLPNDRVGGFVEQVARTSREAQIVLLPRGSLPIQPPLDEVRARVKDVSRRSTLELVIGALQSLGSWWGMLAYSTLSGLVAAYGVLFDASYLLVAAMLIAPMGAPAMVCVVGTAIGDARMVWRGTRRFFTALLVLAAMAALLGLAYGIEVSTATMEQISSLSAWSVTLALVGGAAGAQALVRSDRDSLVTGTATGFLVAVALSPPAAVLGLSAALQRWNYAVLMAFLLLLTYVGIIAGGWASIALLGVGPHETTVGRGSRTARLAIAAAAIVAVAGMVLWQTQQVPRFRKADLARQAVAEVRSAVQRVPGVALVEASAHFTRQDLSFVSGEGLLLDVVVERRAAGAESPVAADDAAAVRAAVAAEIRAALPGVHPFVRVSVLPRTP